MTHKVLLSLGSSIEPRKTYLDLAVSALESLEETSSVRVSPIHETEPMGAAQNPFLNMAVTLAVSDLTPHEFLQQALVIEASLGRTRTVHWGDRTIDIDIILWGESIVRDETLTIPHPFMAERSFVLAPATQIAPDWMDPVSGLSISQLLQRLEAVPCNV
ncbi:2-amino-4-hydroxy-6-hydroxymethyldihydropteridine diphosphokinase [Myxococcota bacterium]|nr:2-amino-4-hydroxy-6-hydroxymethyldihydropteridine diphosphokinase [Myxococcota bacterium]